MSEIEGDKEKKIYMRARKERDERREEEKSDLTRKKALISSKKKTEKREGRLRSEFIAPMRE